MLESKRTYRAHLAALPIGEKLRMLDALRARQLAIRSEAGRPDSVIREEPPPHGTALT